MNLIQRGANVNELSGFLDKNPLHLACEYGHFSCARLFANSENINLDSCGEYINGSTALHICAEFNQMDIMKMLVNKGANIEKLGRFSTIGTPLHIACVKGNIHAVNELIQLGANINSRDELNNTPLHVTCQFLNFYSMKGDYVAQVPASSVPTVQSYKNELATEGAGVGGC